MVFVAKIFQGIEISSDKISFVFGINVKGGAETMTQVIFNAPVYQGPDLFIDQFQVPVENPVLFAPDDGLIGMCQVEGCPQSFRVGIFSLFRMFREKEPFEIEEIAGDLPQVMFMAGDYGPVLIKIADQVPDVFIEPKGVAGYETVDDQLFIPVVQ